MHRQRSSAARVVVLALLGCLVSVAAAAADEATNARIQRLERALENKGLLDLVRQVELLQAEVRQLRGELENQIFALEQQRKAQKNAYLDIDQRLGSLEQGGVISVPPGTGIALTPATPQPPVDPPLPTLAAPADQGIAGAPADPAIALAPVPAVPAETGDAATPIDAAPAAPAAAAIVDVPLNVAAAAAPTIDSAASETAYREAFGLLKAGQYEESIAAFNAYLEQYPQSQYADNAQYWLGEAYYVKRQFEPAIEQYQKLVQNYPASKKQSHALLKIAYSYDELGQPEQAVSVLTTLKTQFPGSTAARLADERMQRLRAAAP